MAFQHGTNAVVKLDDSGGSLQTITAYITDVSITKNGDPVDVTTLSKTNHAFITGIAGATISITFVYDPTADAICDAAVNAIRSFELHPQGTAGGSPKFTGEVIGSSYTVNAPIGGASTATFQATVTDSLTRGTN